MTLDDYLRFTVGGINVDSAIRRGADAEEIRDWCRETLATVFASGEETVLIPGYVATLSRTDGE